MSYAIAVWEGARPATEDAATATFKELADRYIGSEVRGAPAPESAPPTPAIAGFVTALLARWPDLMDVESDEDCPWGDGPLIDDACGPIIIFAVVGSMLDVVVPFVAAEAGRRGLVCFDPQGPPFLIAAPPEQPTSPAAPKPMGQAATATLRAGNALVRAGYRPDVKDRFAWDVNETVTGLVILERGNGQLYLRIAGSYKPLEAIVAHLSRGIIKPEALHTYSYGTLLEHVVPDGARGSRMMTGGWRYEGLMYDYQVADHLVHTMRRYGQPWVIERASPIGVLQELRLDARFQGGAPFSTKRLPVMLWLLGDTKGALKAMDKCIHEFGRRQDESAEECRRYAERFRAFVAAGGTFS